MHFALSEGKRLLHYDDDYAFCMETPNARLRAARAEKFDTAIEAADAMGIPHSTYIGHENGHRGFPAKRAPIYARRFGVSEEWLLYGKGGKHAGTSNAAPSVPTEDQLAAMLAEAQSEIAVTTPLSGWPRAVASNLREQLMRFQSSGLAGSSGPGSPAPAPGKDAQSGSPTKRFGREGSRTS